MSATDSNASKSVKYSAFSEPFSTEKRVEEALAYLCRKCIGKEWANRS